MSEISPDDVRQLCGQDSPVLCHDGKFGMLVIYPGDNESDCGVQVPGEDHHRWIKLSDLKASAGGALKQNGSSIAEPCAHPDMAQNLLSIDWICRGGLLIQE